MAEPTKMKEEEMVSLKKLAGFGISALVASLILLSCENPSGEPYPNSLPDTRLANAPANDTTAQYILQGAIPEQTLYWVGDDPDGFLVAFKFRWIDYHNAGPDSTPWVTLLNLTNLSGTPLDTLILVSPTAGSLFRVYNFFATIDPAERALIDAIVDSLVTGRMFAVPYPNGPVLGDSVQGADPVQVEAPTKANFIFNSPADSNQHRFEVKAVDNSDAEDPTPAFVHFWTLRSPGPILFQPTGPSTGTAPFILTCPTERLPGLTFGFSGLDPSTDERVYSWSIDDTIHWSEWSSIPSALVSGSDFQQTGSDTHTIFVRARNRWGVLSQIVSRRFRARIPNLDLPGWPRRTLFINNTRSTGAGGIDSNSVNNFYREVLDSLGKRDSMDVWTLQGRGFAWPGPDVIQNYSSILISAEQWVTVFIGGSWRFDAGDQAQVQAYLSIGGKLIWSGTPNIQNMILGYDNWSVLVFHVASTSQVPFAQNTALDFIGVSGANGYPAIELDTTKVRADSGYAIRNIALCYPSGFGQTTSYFVSKSGNPFFDDNPVGIRYLAPPPTSPGCRQMFSVVHMGFPLYFAKKSHVIQSLKKAYSDLNESSIP
ncbi:MAG: hypothetical protein ACKVRP_04700 [Bacteroidota bacterium]